MEHEKMLKLNARWVMQGNLTDECWRVQVWGPQTCQGCTSRDKPYQCTGINIRRKGMNRKGFEVPLRNWKR